MKLVTFRAVGTAHEAIGVLHDDGSVTDLAADPALPVTMIDFVALGRAGLDGAAAVAGTGTAISADQIELLAPIRPRNNVMAVGRNYYDHAQEFSDSGFDASEVKVVPDYPIVFTKANSSIVGPTDPIDISNDPLQRSDYEGELGVVIGPGGKRIMKNAAWDHVYGYTVVNDVTARLLQHQHVQFFIGKSPDTYCPMGPCIVTRDELVDISSARLTTVVNGELRQDATISMLIFDIPTLIETLSAAIRLEAGDVIATGTPVGTGMGLEPPVYLAAGDLVEVSVEGIGTISNPVING
ncbi:MAG: fumarylacetoacetate hydrolase family protein [Acidimicrobiia bacterium]|nr:fumarylacetoacetate hydrolase family protein [Acidimicrobiia bacterium]